jgi:hypothetical protein
LFVIDPDSWVAVVSDGKKTARVRCPGCKKWLLLNHEIAANGEIAPSLDCPLCDFHAYGRLDGWR